MDGQRWFKVLVDHLISLGHRRIAYIGAAPDLRIQADRLAGYQHALDGDWAGTVPRLHSARRPERRWRLPGCAKILSLPAPPTAIACIDDMTAMGVLHAAHDRGLEVGRDLAVAGFDGILGYEHTQPPLTTVNQPIYQIARRMAAILISMIRGGLTTKEHVYIEPTLEIRQSTLGDRKP